MGNTVYERGAKVVDEVTQKRSTDELCVGWWTELQYAGVVTLDRLNAIKFRRWLVWAEEYGLKYGFNVDLDILRTQRTAQGYEFWLA